MLPCDAESPRVELLDAYGRPIDKRSLREVHDDDEDAAGWPVTTSRGAVAWALRDSVVDKISPERVGRLLRAADGGDLRSYWTLAEEIEERDLHYRSVLSTRRMRIAAITPAVEPADDSAEEERIAEEVRQLVWSPRFTRLVDGMLDAIAKGISITEIMWDVSEGQFLPIDFEWKDPRWFKVDPRRLRELRFDDGTEEGRALTPGKYVVHNPRLKCGLPIRQGLSRPVSIAYVFKSYNLRDCARFLEVYGIPARIGRYPQGSTKEQQDRLLRAARLMGSDAACIIPDDMNLELLNGHRGASADGFLGSVTYWDRQTSKAVLGQTSSAEGSGGDYKASAGHESVRLDIAQHDAQQAAATITEQVVNLFVQLNHGVRKRYTSVTLNVPKSEDLVRFATAIVQLVDRGLEIDQEQVRERLGLAAPEAGKTLLRPAAQRTESPARDEASGTPSEGDDEPEEADDDAS